MFVKSNTEAWSFFFWTPRPRTQVFCWVTSSFSLHDEIVLNIQLWHNKLPLIWKHKTDEHPGIILILWQAIREKTSSLQRSIPAERMSASSLFHSLWSDTPVERFRFQHDLRPSPVSAGRATHHSYNCCYFSFQQLCREDGSWPQPQKTSASQSHDRPAHRTSFGNDQVAYSSLARIVTPRALRLLLPEMWGSSGTATFILEDEYA